jgi:hypothetical protein
MQKSAKKDKRGKGMEDEKVKETLWKIQELMEYTGWGRNRISKMCNEGKLPHIAARPNLFIPEAVKQALFEMQVGGRFAKVKPRSKKAAQ